MSSKKTKKEHTLALIQDCFYHKKEDLDLSKCDLAGDDFARSLLAQCRWLKKLILPIKPLGNLDFLARFAALETLYIYGKYNPTVDFGFLASLPLLNMLVLRVYTDEDAPLDFDFLQACQQLKTLNISFSNLEGLPNFPILPKLALLNLRGNAIEDALILPPLPALENINIGHNYVENIDCLLSCRQLKEIWADDNSFVELPDLSQWPKLEIIDFSENKIEKIFISAPLDALEKVHLGDNLLVDISPLAACVALKELNIYHNPIADLTPLLSLLNLEILHANSCNLLTPPPAALVFIGENKPLHEVLPTAVEPAEIDKIWPLLHSPDAANQDLAELLARAAEWPNATTRAYFGFSR
jgi:Leucine-rich repeat (LRR) protein